MDVKMGVVTWNRRAGLCKHCTSWLLSKYRPFASLGFRIVGMKVFNPETEEYLTLKNIDYPRGGLGGEERVMQAFETFFCVYTSIYCIQNVDVIICKLRQIELWFERNRKLRLLSSSILIIYESVPKSPTDEPHVVVKMIDFAHAFSSSSKDENYLHGVRNTIRCLEELKERHKWLYDR